VEDTAGVFRPSTGMFYLSNSNDRGFADLAFVVGPIVTPGIVPFVMTIASSGESSH